MKKAVAKQREPQNIELQNAEFRRAGPVPISLLRFEIPCSIFCGSLGIQQAFPARVSWLSDKNCSVSGIILFCGEKHYGLWDERQIKQPIRV
jgi:hypothetical protein